MKTTVTATNRYICTLDDIFNMLKLTYFTAEKALNSSIDCVSLSRSLSLSLFLFLSTFEKKKKTKTRYPGGVAIENDGVCLYDSQTKREKKRNNIIKRRAATNNRLRNQLYRAYTEIYTNIHTLLWNRDIRSFDLSLYHFRQHTNIQFFERVSVCVSECLCFS